MSNELREVYQEMLCRMDEAGENLEKFESGNAAAGTRLRWCMQELKKYAQDVRVSIQAIKNNK